MRRTTSPPTGRVTTPAKRTSPPTTPEMLRPWPSCSSSVTIQFPATTESPNVAICTAPSGQSRRSPSTPRRPLCVRIGGDGLGGGSGDEDGEGRPRVASASPVQYGRAPTEARRRAAGRSSVRARRPPSWRRRTRPARKGRLCRSERDRSRRRSRRRSRSPSATRAARPSSSVGSSRASRVCRCHDREQDARPMLRAPTRSISRPPGIWTARCVTKSAGRQQPDRRERHPVARTHHPGDCADVGDVPRHGRPEHEPAGDRRASTDRR